MTQSRSMVCMVCMAVALACLGLLVGVNGEEKHLWLVLATGNRLMWYTPGTGEFEVLRDGGVHYGVFPGTSKQGVMTTLWSSVRMEVEDKLNADEYLLELDAKTGKEVTRILIPSHDTHDAVRRGNSVYVASTIDGNIVEFKYPEMKLVKRHNLFTLKDHVNTLAPVEDDNMFAMLHMCGESKLVNLRKTEDGTLEPVSHMMGFGYTCHAIVSYDRYLLLVLDSTGGGLIQINYQTGCWETLYKDPFNNRFYKGLAVINDIAYFGISHKTKRSTRLSRSENSELAAFHLKQRKLLWRKQLNTSGMLNVVAAPQISEESTYKAMVTKDYVDLSVKPVQPALLKSVNNKAVLTAVQKLEKQGFKVAEAGSWATGLPHMNLDLKNSEAAWEAGVFLPLGTIDVVTLRNKLATAPPDVWDMTKHERNNQIHDLMIKDLHAFGGHTKKTRMTQVVHLIQSEPGDPEQAHLMPFYQYFIFEIEQIVEALLGPGGISRVIRMSIEVLDHGAPFHRDGSSLVPRTHRIYIPIDGTFPALQVCAMADKASQGANVISMGDKLISMGDKDCVVLPEVVGLAYEFNNRLLHQVVADDDKEYGGRVLAMDVAGPLEKRLHPISPELEAKCSPIVKGYESASFEVNE